MKKLLCATGALLAATIILTGCTRPEQGAAPAVDSFALKAPAAPTSIKQGETQTVKLVVNRGKEFKQDVVTSQ
ncbi:MAG: hypothetical protein K2R98_18215 [Gemmataceae bacterium]|nr:hypothetical protein [Gemmataceae bacterium]